MARTPTWYVSEFLWNNEICVHTLQLVDDSACIKDSAGVVQMLVNNCGTVMDKEGLIVGSFSIVGGNWLFKAKNSWYTKYFGLDHASKDIPIYYLEPDFFKVLKQEGILV